jgi:hypothetical protein
VSAYPGRAAAQRAAPDGEIGHDKQRRYSVSFEPKFPSTGRIEAFSDGVIAIIITIMVLDLRPPGHEINHNTLRPR